MIVFVISINLLNHSIKILKAKNYHEKMMYFRNTYISNGTNILISSNYEYCLKNYKFQY